MLTFDRLKLVTSSQYATNLNQSQFLMIPKKHGSFYYKYQQETPFFLAIVVSPDRQELTIEFTGKILQDEYPNLINLTNIRYCLERITNMNLCDLNIEAIVQDSKVCLCDVTKDVVCPHPMKDIKTHLKASLTNHDKWLVRKCQNNGLEIYNSVTTKRLFKRFIIYDKSKELKRAENSRFLDSLDSPKELLNRFADKIRVELNLRSMKQIRSYLHIPNSDLQSVLHSSANPILEIWDEAIAETTSSSTRIYNKTEKLALLQQCNYDLQAVEMRIRENTPKTSSIRRKMEPYKKLLQDIQGGCDTIKIRDLLL